MCVEIKTDSQGERGLFATENISKGKHICYLPIDYLKLNEKWFTTNEKNKGPVNFRYGIHCDFQIIDKNINLEKNLRLLLENKKSNKTIEICGVSNHKIIKFPFVGHMINDSVNMSILSSNLYKRISERYENVDIGNIINYISNTTCLKIIAKKDIKKGAELYFNYGIEYWKNYSNKNNYEINPEIKIISVR